MNQNYLSAKDKFKELGINTEEVIQRLSNVEISIHCWQGDDVQGFQRSQSLSGGIAVTGNYPGKAKTPQQLMNDLALAFKHIPGKKRINLHAIYAISEQPVSLDQLSIEHFMPWVEFAKKHQCGIDFNPTFFSHPLAESGFTLSSQDDNIRTFWINHAKASRRIAAQIGEMLGSPSLCNIWIPDGMKNPPVDRLGPRKLLKASLDEIYSETLHCDWIIDSLESKVFGIGLEAYTVGSAEFYTNYCATSHCINLIDNGHYHPTEDIADKLSSMLLFKNKLALHVTRNVRWDSDHVVLLDDSLKSIMNEIIRCDVLEQVIIGLDYFDASINRVAAWTIGSRNVMNALLMAMLMPNQELINLQNSGNYTRLLAYEEECKLLPFNEIWFEFCNRNHVSPNISWLDDVLEYELSQQEERK
jgi:L-rhamnose isomerase